MKEQLKTYVDQLFKPYETIPCANELKSEVWFDLEERYEHLCMQGKTDEEACKETLESIGDIKEMFDGVELVQPKNDFIQKDFKASMMKDSDFSNVDLRNAKFSSSQFEQSDFSKSNLTGSTFKASSMRYVSFDYADVTDCNFSVSNLQHASFKEAILNRTKFSKSCLDDVTFENCILKDIDFSMVDLRKAKFINCVIDGGNFEACNISGQCLEGQVLRNVHIGKAYLKDVSFRKATLLNVSFKPPFALTNKYYRVYNTIIFDDAIMDKVTYQYVKSLQADVSKVHLM